MTTTLERLDAFNESHGAESKHRVHAWIARHKTSIYVVAPILIVTGLIRFWNLWGSPGGWNDDEGTYVSQAWAILNDGELAHYTYWYDHPPFGWIQIAGWAWLTDGFGRHDVTIMIGRELIAVYAVIGGGLVYILCRRLGMMRATSAIATTLFMLCPIMTSYGRMVYLDNIALPWVLASMACAVSPRKSNTSALGAALFLAGAALTKETMFVFAPVILWMVWQNSAPAMRIKNAVSGGIMLFATGGFYLLMAVLKGELVPGEGHVSMWGSLTWQVLGRESSGSIFNPEDLAYQWVSRWLEADQWLLFAAIPMAVIALFRRNLWPIVAAGLIHFGLLVRGGYLPIPFVVILVLLAAIIVAGGLDVLWAGWKRSITVRSLMRTSAIAIAAIFVVIAIPHWSRETVDALTADDMSAQRSAIAWINEHSPASMHNQLIVDDNIWPDLINMGYGRDNVDWLFKLDVDADVVPRYIPPGGEIEDSWRTIDYIVIPPLDASVIASRPTLQAAIDHSTVVAEFTLDTPGSYMIYEVQKDQVE